MRLTSICLLRCAYVHLWWTTGSFSGACAPPKLHTSAAPVNAARRTVGLTRLERVTSPLSEECSNRLSYRPRLPSRLARPLIRPRPAVPDLQIVRYRHYCSLGRAQHASNCQLSGPPEWPAYTLAIAEETGLGKGY